MAHEVDAVLRQQVVAGHAQAGERGGAGDRAEMLDVRAGEDRGDAGLVAARPGVWMARMRAAACGLRTTQA